MSDDLNKRGPQDSSRVNTSERWEVQYWTEKFGCSEEELKEAVSKVGSSAVSVEEYLSK